MGAEYLGTKQVVTVSQARQGGAAIGRRLGTRATPQRIRRARHAGRRRFWTGLHLVHARPHSCRYRGRRHRRWCAVDREKLRRRRHELRHGARDVREIGRDRNHRRQRRGPRFLRKFNSNAAKKLRYTWYGRFVHTAPRVRDACTENPKARFLLPIDAYLVLEEAIFESLVVPNSSVGPITYRVEWSKNR